MVKVGMEMKLNLKQKNKRKTESFVIFAYLFVFSLFIFSVNISTVNCVVAGEIRVAIPKDAPFIKFHLNPPGTLGYDDFVVSFNSDGSMSFDFSRGVDGKSYGFQPNSRYEWAALFSIENLEDKPLDYKIMNQGLKYLGVEDGTTGIPFIINGENQKEWATINAKGKTSIKVYFEIPAEATLETIEGTLFILFDRPEDNGDNNDDEDDDSDFNNGSTPGEIIYSSSIDKIKLLDGALIDRMFGYISLSEPVYLTKATPKITLVYDKEVLQPNSKRVPRVYYWNEEIEKWIALASYEKENGQVEAINDGEYQGWFNVFGIIEPKFLDVNDHWAEPVVNRMNGLGIVEGYPEDGLLRYIKLDQNITRAEFTSLLYRILNINPDRPILEKYTLQEARNILAEYYLDAGEIPEWVVSDVAALTKEGLTASGNQQFIANEPITRVEAAVMASKALALFKEHQPLDLSVFNDAKDIPDWSRNSLAKGVIAGYPDGTFRPDEFLTRAEALTVLKRVFINGLGF